MPKWKKNDNNKEENESSDEFIYCGLRSTHIQSVSGTISILI